MTPWGDYLVLWLLIFFVIGYLLTALVRRMVYNRFIEDEWIGEETIVPPRLTAEDIKQCRNEARVEVGLAEKFVRQVCVGYYEGEFVIHQDLIEITEPGDKDPVFIPGQTYREMIPRYETVVEYRDVNT